MNDSALSCHKMFLITGKARSGKNELAKQIDAFHHLNTGLAFYEIALAEPLHYAVGGFFSGWTKDPLGINKETDLLSGMSPRKLMQDWGAYVREHDPDAFCKILETRLLKAPWPLDDTVVVITDCRYDNEVKYFKERCDAVCIRVVRPSIKDGVVRQHHSENGVSDELIDYEIVNDGTIEDLYQKTRLLLKEA